MLTAGTNLFNFQRVVFSTSLPINRNSRIVLTKKPPEQHVKLKNFYSTVAVDVRQNRHKQSTMNRHAHKTA